MCQIIKVAVFVFFANATKSSLINLTWLILPAVQVIFFECITEIESIMRISALFDKRVSRISSIQFSAKSWIFFPEIPSLFALEAIWKSVSSPET